MEFFVREWRQVKLAIDNTFFTYPFSKQYSGKVKAKEVKNEKHSTTTAVTSNDKESPKRVPVKAFRVFEGLKC